MAIIVPKGKIERVNLADSKTADYQCKAVLLGMSFQEVGTVDDLTGKAFEAVQITAITRDHGMRSWLITPENPSEIVKTDIDPVARKAKVHERFTVPTEHHDILGAVIDLKFEADLKII